MKKKIQAAGYGPKGTADAGYCPGARMSGVTWKDALGNFWMFGGNGYDDGTSIMYNYLNDLWRWDGVNWTWMTGLSTLDGIGNYGTQGVPVSTNYAGARYFAAHTVDRSGYIWIFGGFGEAAVYDYYGKYMNDLWRFVQ